MVCYVIPALAAIVHHVLRKKMPAWKNDKHHSWLSLLLLGGAIFGVVDHLWNRELFLLGQKPLLDIMLGFTITIVILAAWAGIVALDKAALKKPAKSAN